MASTNSLPMAYYPQHAYYPSSSLSQQQQQQEQQEQLHSPDAVPSASAFRKCSVKNCNSLLTPDYSGKMCHECRGRHRIYASTKRAKRKMEKLAVNLHANNPDEVAVFLPPDVVNVQDRSHTHTPHTQADQPLPLPEPVPDSYAITWEPNQIDPRLFQSSSSELAGALTLPPLNPVSSDEDEDEEDDTPDPDSSIPPRYCSIKGCKRIISGDYLYKMCQECRTRYRAYGTAKRAKWKRDREIALAELEQLRAAEEERRAAAGLIPLADLPDNERKAWDNTQMPGMPPTPPRDPEPLVLPPVRMCTVSHCHTILTSDYEYRRCEAHRMQNRHHSKLKRVRDKEEKSLPIVDERATEQERAAFEAMLKRKEDGKDASPDISLGNDTRKSIPPPARGWRRTNHVCNIRHCQNLLTTNSPWKMCEFHREKDREARRRKAEQAAEKSQQPSGEDAGEAVSGQRPTGADDGQIASSSKTGAVEDANPDGSSLFQDRAPSDIVFMEPLFPPDMGIPDMAHPDHEQIAPNPLPALSAPIAEASALTPTSDPEIQPNKKRKRAPFKRRAEDVWKVATPSDMAAHATGSSVVAIGSESPSDASAAGTSTVARMTSKKRKSAPSSTADPSTADSGPATAASTPMLSPASVPASSPAVPSAPTTAAPPLGRPSEPSVTTPSYTVPPPAPNGTASTHIQPQFQLPYYMPPPFGLSYQPGQPPFYTPSPFAPIPFPGRGPYTHIMYQHPPAQPSPFTTQSYIVPTLSAAWAGYGEAPNGASSGDVTPAVPAAPVVPTPTEADNSASATPASSAAPTPTPKQNTSAPRKPRANNPNGELTVNMYDPKAKPPRKRRKAVVDTTTLDSNHATGSEQSSMAVFSTNVVPASIRTAPPPDGPLPNASHPRTLGQTNMAPPPNPIPVGASQAPTTVPNLRLSCLTPT
ncbi:hypothetical protein OF83DRAFT_1111973 [Amylostereum chailletii]|nr:hypothetical protein OF83DRAFT_1111973 [Amylostereum chailletii]